MIKCRCILFFSNCKGVFFLKITIKDIAREAGVSTSAVSLVLNKRPCRISQAKRELIVEVAEKYHYRVNQAARSLVTRKTNTLGMIIPDIENPFFSSLCKQMENYCREAGYMLIIANSNDSEENDLHLIDMFISRGVDGIFITPSDESLYNNDRLLNVLTELNIPFIQIDRYFEQLQADSVSYDDEAGAQQAVDYLIMKGHRKIGCIGCLPANNKNGSARVQGYRNALKNANIPILEENIFYNHYHFGNFHYEEGYQAGLQIVTTDLSAIFICNDMMALGFLRCLYDQKKELDTYAIISYDNALNSYMIGKKITSIDQNVEKLSQTSIKRMIARIQDPKLEPERFHFIPELIENDSVNTYEQ